MKLAENILRIIMSLSICMILSCNAFANNNASSATIYGHQNLVATINQAIRSVNPNLSIGIGIKSMKTGEVLYTKNEQRAFVPASILKILTAEAALIYLGADYKFPTRFHTDAKKLTNGILYGNVYLVHSGDPTLTYSDIAELMSALKSQQIQQIQGNVYVDTTAYDEINYGPGWIWNDKRFCYAAPISASIINHNCLTFRITPSKLQGHLANIIESPQFYYASIQNSVVTKASNSRTCNIHLGTDANNGISVTGCMPKGHFIQGVSTVISNVEEYNKSLLRSLFKQAGIQVNGSFASGAASQKLPILASHESKPLSLLITDMLKKSDNIIAGSIFKKVGGIYSKKPGSWENGSYAVSQILAQKAGVNVENMSVIDGSGLSRFNEITPSQMLRLLDFAYHNYSTNYEFISALPVAGIDGTLKHRLSNIAWKVRAKTGTMSGVNSLAGYAITRDKEPIAFVIIVNGHNGMGWKYKELEDKIVTSITKFSRG